MIDEHKYEGSMLSGCCETVAKYPNPPKPMTNPDDRVERVASVIEASLERHGIPLEFVEGTLDDARAAIEAMRSAALPNDDNAA